MDGCRCSACGWVKELASCFPELHRCGGGSLCNVAVVINMRQMLWDATVVTTRERTNPELRALELNLAVSAVVLQVCAEGKCVLHGSSLFFSMI